MDPDTLIGGNRQRFPDTNHSAIAAVQSNDQHLQRRGFDAILANYWKPAYKYVRIKWQMNNEDAKDITQGFFAEAFEKNYFADYDATKASFQTFLRTCLDRFISNFRKSQSRLKRGAAFEHIATDVAVAEDELAKQIVSNELSPEDYFHREWMRNLFSLAVVALKHRYESSGRATQFRLFEIYDLDENEQKLSYASLAADFGLNPTTVTNYLAAARRDFRRAVLDKLREITATDDEFRREARELLGVDLT